MEAYFVYLDHFILRSTEDYEKAKYWIGIAEEVEPENHKTIALKAELLCMKSIWKDAKEMLDQLQIFPQNLLSK